MMKITGQKDGNRSHLGGITAKVYVGGILGYNVQDTSLEISSLINGTPVTATGFLIAEELTGTDNLDLYADNAKKTYSYAGGIVGKCSESMKITNCSADDTGRVISSAPTPGDGGGQRRKHQFVQGGEPGPADAELCRWHRGPE
ncbi:MAG: hypothetical protein ACLRJV_16820 [Eubacteriales bacterium]